MRGSSWARRIREDEDEQDLDETHVLLSDQPQHKLVGGAGGASGLGYILGWIVAMTASAFLLYWFIREVGWLKDDHYQQSWGGIVIFGSLGIVGLTSVIGLGCFKANQKRTGTIWVTHWLSLAFVPVVIIFGLSVWKFWIEKSHAVTNDDLLVLPKPWLLALCGIALAGLLIVQWTSLTLADRDYTQDMYQWTLFVSYLCLMQAGLGVGVLLVLSLNQVPEFMTSLSAWSVWAGLVFAAVQAIVAIMGMAKPLDNFRVMYILLPIASLVLAVCCFFNYTLSGHLNTLFPDIKGKYTTIDINGEPRHAYLVISSALGIVWSVSFTILVLFGVLTYLTYDEGNHGKRGGCDCLCCGSEDGSRYTAYA